MSRPRVLTIAGSDSSGGAGIEADLKVLTAHSVYGMTAITALTAQNTHGVKGVVETPIDFLRKAIEAVAEDVGVDVIKTGMLPSVEAIDVVCETLDKYKIRKIVVDPVMISTSGHNLIPELAIRSLVSNLLPKTHILTPNIPEARRLVGWDYEPKGVEDMVKLAKEIKRLGPEWVLLKGGHIPLDGEGKATKDESRAVAVVDVLTNGDEVLQFPDRWIRSKDVHGTGCGLASAIAANLAMGKDIVEAVRASTRFITNSIASVTPATKLGQGNGPVDFTYGLTLRPFAPGQFLHYLTNHPSISSLWQKYTFHPFVERAKDGSLSLSAFRNYVTQDYLYLTHYARAVSQHVFKSSRLDEIMRHAKALGLVKMEADRNLALAERLGLSKSTVENTEESLSCKAYSRFLVDIATSETQAVLMTSMMPCLLGYRVIGVRMGKSEFKGRRDRSSTTAGIYWDWMSTYADDEYGDAIMEAEAELEEVMSTAGLREIDRCVWAFREATKFEIEFWNSPME